jgi:hypothetical protein
VWLGVIFVYNKVHCVLQVGVRLKSSTSWRTIHQCWSFKHIQCGRVAVLVGTAPPSDRLRALKQARTPLAGRWGHACRSEHALALPLHSGLCTVQAMQGNMACFTVLGAYGVAICTPLRANRSSMLVIQRDPNVSAIPAKYLHTKRTSKEAVHEKLPYMSPRSVHLGSCYLGQIQDKF